MTAAPHTTSQIDTTWFLVFFGALALASTIAAVIRARRTHDIAPVAVVVGALVCSLNEPLFDELGKIVYADDATRAYSAFGRDIPLFLCLGYVPWVAGLSLLIAELMRRGTSRATLHWIALGSFLSVTAVETAGTSVEAWTYYGEPPLKYLGVAPMMAPVPIVCGAAIFLAGTRLTGARRALIGLAPLFALPAVYASAGMPMGVALHGDVSKPVQYGAGLATLALCAVFVVAGTALAARWRAIAVDEAHPCVDVLDGRRDLEGLGRANAGDRLDPIEHRVEERRALGREQDEDEVELAEAADDRAHPIDLPQSVAD